MNTDFSWAAPSRTVRRMGIAAVCVVGAVVLTGCVVAPVDDGYGYSTTTVYTTYGYPPPPRVEYRPAPPGVGYVWMDGSWWWSGSRYDWRPGRWAAPGYRIAPPPPRAHLPAPRPQMPPPRPPMPRMQATPPAPPPPAMRAPQPAPRVQPSAPPAVRQAQPPSRSHDQARPQPPRRDGDRRSLGARHERDDDAPPHAPHGGRLPRP